jgi:crotonobetainyl-CoA:carnitine CoA-transferase CaiB-like acyl-CoA transferase
LGDDKVDKPLQGIQVIEMGAFIAGPFASRLLAEFGAEVIKVEPLQGDQIRKWGLHAEGQDSYWSMVQTRNKRSIAVDLHTVEGQDIVRDLISRADVVIENFKPGTLAKWRLSHEEMRALNPGLVITSISGFGQTGPYHQRPGFGNIAESMGGMRYLTGFSDRPPVRIGLSVGDSIAALYAVIGTLLSLYQRDKKGGGQGQVVDVALYEAVYSLLEGIVPEYAHLHKVRERTGNQLAATAPSNIYMTKDGRWIAIGANSDSLFRRFMQVIGRDDLAIDPNHQDNIGRVREVDKLDRAIEDWTRMHELNYILDVLTKEAIPAGPIYSIADIMADPHYQAREMFVKIADPRVGEIVMPGIVPKLSETPGSVEWAGPDCGAHTEEILQELGYDTDQVSDLHAKGVICCAVSRADSPL